MSDEAPSQEEPTVDLTLKNIHSPAAKELLHHIIFLSLTNYGQVTFAKLDDGSIVFCNPFHVHIHPQAIEEIKNKPFRKVRPIIGTGLPSYVMWESGVLWEITPHGDEIEKDNG